MWTPPSEQCCSVAWEGGNAPTHARQNWSIQCHARCLSLQKRKLDAQRARRESISNMFGTQRQVELDQEERAAEVMLYPEDSRQTVQTADTLS